MRDNPLKYADPTGHNPLLLIAVLVIGAVVLTADTPRLGPGEAASIYDLVAAGLQHEGHANIVNEGLQSLQDDPSVQAAQDRIIGEIVSLPEYGERSFTINEGISDSFTANGPSGNWKQAALENNQAFWMVHTATLSATNTTVAADGTISTTWQIQDYFDFIPGPNHSDEYNRWASKVHYIYNDLLGAEESYPTNAYWNDTIPPQEKKSTPQ